MVGVRISTRTDLKTDLLDVYNFINENNSGDALVALKSAKLNVIIYYNTRGLDCIEFMPLFNDIENLLMKNHLANPDKNRLCSEKLYNYLFQLNTSLKFNVADQSKIGEIMKDPVSILRNIVDDLIDDYSEFNLTGGQEIIQKNRNVLDLIRSDLLEIRELEPYFKQMSKKIIEQFNMVLKFVNLCLMVLPQAKDVTIAATTQKLFRTYFENLFNSLTDIFVPVEQQKQEEQTVVETSVETPSSEQQTVQKKQMEEKKQEESKELQKKVEEITDDITDLAELEKKAKEGVLEDDDEQR